MAREKSRTTRWQEACSAAVDARSKVQEAAGELSAALTELRDVQSEYENWRDGLPENLQGSALGEKLDTVCDIDIESGMDDPLDDWGTISDAIDEAEGADLPMGFGRD